MGGDFILNVNAKGGGCPPGGGAVGGALAPSLSISNNSTLVEGTINKLTGGHKRTAHALAANIQELARIYGPERLVFHTMTFPDFVRVMKTAQKRFNSLNTHVIKKRFIRLIGVWERGDKSRLLHFHGVGVLADDIRTGFDFDAFERSCDLWELRRAAKKGRGQWTAANQSDLDRWEKIYIQSATPALRAEWAFWMRITRELKYRFGRIETVPIKSTAEAIARYVGKYISKHINQREESDKGARCIRYIGFQGVPRSNSRFAFNTPNGWLWRRKTEAYAEKIGAEDTDALKAMFGHQWAYMLKDEIMSMKVEEVFPDRATAERSSDLSWRRGVAMDFQDEKAGRVYEVRQLPASATVDELDIKLAAARSHGVAYTDAFGQVTLGHDPCARLELEKLPVVGKPKLSTDTKMDPSIQAFKRKMPCYWEIVTG